MDIRRHVTAGRLSELFGDETRRDRPGDPDHGLAPGRRAGVGGAPAADPAGAGGVRRRGQRLPRLPRAEPAGGGVLPAPARRARLHARAVDPGRLAGVAQGDGVGPARQHGRRDRPGAGRGRPHAGRGRAALPGVPLRRPPADRRLRRRRRRRLRPGRDGGTRNPERPPPSYDRATAALERVQDALDAVPTLVGRGDGIGSNSWVVGGDHTSTGQPAAGQRPAPRHLAAGHLDADGPALPDGLRATARWTSRASRSPACPA